MNRIGFFSMRGGVGKSTLSAYIAKALSKNNKVLLVDMSSGSRSLDLICELEDSALYNWADIGSDFPISSAVCNIGFDVLNAPASKRVISDELSLFSADMSKYDYVLYDFGALSDDEISAVRKSIDYAAIVSRCDIDSIRMAEAMDMRLRKARIFKTSLLLNMRERTAYNKRNNLSDEDIKELIELTIVGEVERLAADVLSISAMSDNLESALIDVVNAIIESRENIAKKKEMSFFDRLKRLVSSR